jgi:glucokinase
MKYETTELRKFKKSDYSDFVLAGDIGATNTSLSIAGIKGKEVQPLFILRFMTKELMTLSSAINETLKFADEKYKIHVAKACLSPAGPLDPDRKFCRLTNSPLAVDVKAILSDTLLGSVALINDFEAIGFGLPFLDVKKKDDIIELVHPGDQKPLPAAKSVKGIIGAGTGLGKSIMVYDNAKDMYVPFPSEGGHEDLPVVDSFEYELMQFVKDRRGGEAPADYEDVLSGKGIVAVYDYIVEMEMFDYNAVTDLICKAKEEEKAVLISKNALTDDACRKTLEMFTRFYARALRNMALSILARGGMYIAGGIAAKNLSFFQDKKFMEEFETNHDQRKILKEIPVFVITNYNVSLFGAANVAANFPEMAVRK